MKKRTVIKPPLFKQLQLGDNCLTLKNTSLPAQYESGRQIQPTDVVSNLTERKLWKKLRKICFTQGTKYRLNLKICLFPSLGNKSLTEKVGRNYNSIFARLSHPEPKP